MASIPSVEGEIEFLTPHEGKPCKTWYKIVGDLENTVHPPLVALHGGPGAGHEYLEPLIDLCSPQHGLALVFYDQAGCGRSTHFRDRRGDDAFWTFDLFTAQLDALVDHLGLRSAPRGFHVLGQSWGGMLAGAYAARRPRGLRRLVLGGAPASFPLFVEGGRRQRAGLPADVREALERGDRDSPEYKRASGVFYKKHVCSLDPLPAPIQTAFANLEDDSTAYNTMQGPSEIVVTGNLKNWDAVEEAKNIDAEETLLINGRYDEASELCVAPWFRSIPRVKWVVFEKSAHMPFWEERERWVQVVGAFLTGC
ncbi:Alpha/Beta hydrolase protein [Xylariomycetidae sp. FL0641]|nr:Alpha/Beta hydrolase protein [Xylariomycetidae sp. FL0641]